MTAPVGSLRWQLSLLGATAAGAVVAVCPIWWAVAIWWDVRDRRRSKLSRTSIPARVKGGNDNTTYPWWSLIARLRQWWGIRQWAKKLAADVADLND